MTLSHIAAPVLALALFGAIPQEALAQQALKGLGFEAGLSFMGAYVAPTYQVAPNFTARAPIYFGTINGTHTYEGNPVIGKVDAESYALIADYHPGGGALRLSTGIGFGGLSVSGKVTNPVFNGNTYAGVSDVSIKQTHSVTPSFSVGYAKIFGGGFGFTADLGVRIANYTIAASSDFVPNAAKAQFAADLAAANADLAKQNLTPYLALGLAYRF